MAQMFSSRSIKVPSWVRATLVVIVLCFTTFHETAYSGVVIRSTAELYGVIVGVSRYGSSDFPPLEMSAKDAKDFYHFLKEREALFVKSHILPPLLDEQATRANVVKALREQLRGAGKDDIVIIYFSGHGTANPASPDEFYFATHDAQLDNLFGTALLMNDQNLFKGIDSDKVLLIADACHSGGFAQGLQRATAKSASQFISLFQQLNGRVAILSSKPDEMSYEKSMFNNSVFTHYLLKGMRGEAWDGEQKGVITVKGLYDYVYRNTKEATSGLQHPQICSPKGKEDNTPIFKIPEYSNPLNVSVQFYYEDDDASLRLLSNGDVLKSGQKIGLNFTSDSDCYAYILWWDSSGGVGCLFPNSDLTEGSGEIKSGQQYWMPSKGGDRYYVLDDEEGDETIYFVASRKRLTQIDELCEVLRKESGKSSGSDSGKAARQNIAREVNLMGIRPYTVPKEAAHRVFSDKMAIFRSVKNQLTITGAEAVYRLRFRHTTR